MIGEEVDVGEVPRRLDEVARVIEVRHRAQGQALVHAEPLHAEAAGPLQHGIGDLLVVHEPAAVEALGRGAGVGLPRVHLERGRLHVHEVEVGLAELRRHQPVRQHAARLGDAIDLVPDMGHLPRRHHRLLRIGPGGRGDEPDGGLAVEEDLLDHVLPGEIGQGAAVGGELRVEPPRVPAKPQQPLLAHPAPRALGVGGIVARAHVVQLHVEDEGGVALALLEGDRLRRLHREHVEEAPEHRVHGQERDRHAPARPQELAAAQTEPRRQPTGLRQDARLDAPLGGGLRQRRELLVGDEPRRQRHLAGDIPDATPVRTELERVGCRHGGSIAPRPPAPPPWGKMACP